MIRLSNIYKRFNNLEVLRGVNIEVKEGEVVAIIGSSGTGKSTLLRCINFLEIPDKGKIQIDNLEYDCKKISKKEIHEIRKLTAMVFQNFNLFRNKTVLENITESLIIVKKMKEAEAIKIGLSILTRVGLIDKWASYPSTLSGGQQQRVAIGRAMAINPKIILFDEPTSALDPELVGEVLELIKELAMEKMTMIIVTHEMLFAREVANKIVFMDNGKILESGTPDEIFNNPKNERTKRFLERAIRN